MPHPHCPPSIGGNIFPQSLHLSHRSYCTITYIYTNSQPMFINIAGLRTPARVAESGVSVLISLNHIHLQHIRFSFSFQLEYISLYSIKSSNLITESLFNISPAIHIHNRNTFHIVLLASKPISQLPETSRQLNRLTPRRPIREPDRDTWCLRLSCTHT